MRKFLCKKCIKEKSWTKWKILLFLSIERCLKVVYSTFNVNSFIDFVNFFYCFSLIKIIRNTRSLVKIVKKDSFTLIIWSLSWKSWKCRKICYNSSFSFFAICFFYKYNDANKKHNMFPDLLKSITRANLRDNDEHSFKKKTFCQIYSICTHLCCKIAFNFKKIIVKFKKFIEYLEQQHDANSASIDRSILVLIFFIWVNNFLKISFENMFSIKSRFVLFRANFIELNAYTFFKRNVCLSSLTICRENQFSFDFVAMRFDENDVNFLL
jgi:hypothetical protein